MEALVILGLLYFTPTLIALLRGHHNAAPIFVLNAARLDVAWLDRRVCVVIYGGMAPYPGYGLRLAHPGRWDHLVTSDRSTGASTMLAVTAITLLVLLLLL